MTKILILYGPNVQDANGDTIVCGRPPKREPTLFD